MAPAALTTQLVLMRPAVVSTCCTRLTPKSSSLAPAQTRLPRMKMEPVALPLMPRDPKHQAATETESSLPEAIQMVVECLTLASLQHLWCSALPLTGEVVDSLGPRGQIMACQTLETTDCHLRATTTTIPFEFI